MLKRGNERENIVLLKLEPCSVKGWGWTRENLLK